MRKEIIKNNFSEKLFKISYKELRFAKFAPFWRFWKRAILRMVGAQNPPKPVAASAAASVRERFRAVTIVRAIADEIVSEFPRVAWLIERVLSEPIVA